MSFLARSEKIEIKISAADLKCEGDLRWNNVYPGSTIVGEFTVENIDDEESELSWEIIETPSWGEWTFLPSQGDDLKPSDGGHSVTVVVETPEEKDRFDGKIVVSNLEDKYDTYEISVSLSTIKSKEKSLNLKLFEDFPVIYQFLAKLNNLFNFP